MTDTNINLQTTIAIGHLHRHQRYLLQLNIEKDALVAALEQAEAALGVILLDENIKAWMAVNDPMAQQQAQRAFDALEAAKYKKTGYGLGTVLADAERAWSEDCQRS